MPLSLEQQNGRSNCLITASEVPALFGLDPRVSPFELYHRKKGNLEAEDISDKEFIRWGNRLEEPIAREIASERGWKIRKVKRHLRYNLTCDVSDEHHARRLSVLGAGKEPRLVDGLLGASLDFEIVKTDPTSGVQHGMAPFEIKAVGRFQALKWNNGPPLPVLLQLQAQIACAGASWGAVGGLRSVTGPADVAEIPRHEGTIRKILVRILEFEVELAEGRPPAPDFSLTGDVEAMIALHRSLDEAQELDLRGRPDLEVKVDRLKYLGEEGTKREKEAKAIWAELLPDITVAPGTLAGRVEFNELWMKTWPLAGGFVSYEKKPSVGHGIYRRKS